MKCFLEKKSSTQKEEIAAREISWESVTFFLSIKSISFILVGNPSHFNHFEFILRYL